MKQMKTKVEGACSRRNLSTTSDSQYSIAEKLKCKCGHLCRGEEISQCKNVTLFLPGGHFRGLTCYCCSNSMTRSSVPHSPLLLWLLSVLICGFHASPALEESSLSRGCQSCFHDALHLNINSQFTRAEHGLPFLIATTYIQCTLMLTNRCLVLYR